MAMIHGLAPLPAAFVGYKAAQGLDRKLMSHSANIALACVCLVIAVLSSAALGRSPRDINQAGMGPLPVSQKAFDEELREAIALKQKNAPQKIDSITTFEGIALEGKVIRITYKADSNINAIPSAELENKVAKASCGDSFQKSVMGRGYSFNIVYIDVRGRALASYMVTEGRCREWP